MLTFKELYEGYAADVYRFALYLSGDEFDAADITSDTFVRAWVRRDAIRTETLKAYLLTIARNLYLEMLRNNKRQVALMDSYTNPAPAMEQVIEAKETLAQIGRLLQSLPEVDRAAFLLRVQHDLAYDEIGRVLEISVVAARVKVHRVRRKLLVGMAPVEVKS